MEHINSISDYLNDYLKRFKIVNPDTLFPPNWEVLKENRCPLCFNRLKFPKGKNVAICNGVKHKTFVIHLETLKRLSTCISKRTR